MRRICFSILIVGLLAFVFGCSTSIPVTVTKPAEINMSGNRVIAVLDFRYPVKDKTITGKDLLEWAISKLTGIDLLKEMSVEQKVADHTTSQVIMTLLNTGYFQLVSPQEVAKAMQGVISSRTTAGDRQRRTVSAGGQRSGVDGRAEDHRRQHGTGADRVRADDQTHGLGRDDISGREHRNGKRGRLQIIPNPGFH